MYPNAVARESRARGRGCRAGWTRWWIESSCDCVIRSLSDEPLAGFSSSILYALGRDWAIAVGSAVAEKLPDFSHFRDHIQVEIGHNDLIFVTARLGDDFSPRIAEIALAIKFADAPRLFNTYTVDGSDEISVRYCMSWLLKLPQIFRQSSDRGGWIENNFGSV